MSRASTDARILANWEIFAEDEGRSTIVAIQMTADASGVDYGRVVDALQRRRDSQAKITEEQSS